VLGYLVSKLGVCITSGTYYSTIYLRNSDTKP